jgi:hypothetical protein
MTDPPTHYRIGSTTTSVATSSTSTARSRPTLFPSTTPGLVRAPSVGVVVGSVIGGVVFLMILLLLLFWYLRRRNLLGQPDFESVEGPSFNPDAMVRSPTPVDRSSFMRGIRPLVMGSGVSFTREVLVRPLSNPSGDGDGDGASFNRDRMVRRSPRLNLNSVADPEARRAVYGW